MSKLMKVLSAEEIQNETGTAGVDKTMCTYVQSLCNINWPSFLTGSSIFDATLGGGLDCGTCSYWANQCGWSYIWSGSGNAWTGGCGSTCICH